MISCSRYPAQMGLLGTTFQSNCLEAARTAMPWHWAPWELWPMLSTVCGIRGDPRCPIATTNAATAVAYLRDGVWGPPPLGHAVQDLLDEIRTIVRREDIGLPGFLLHPSCKRALRHVIPIFGDTNDVADTSSAALKRAGPGLYIACWLTRRKNLQWHQWLCRRSRGRTWWPTFGTEWAILGVMQNFNQAYYCVRVLADRLQGLASTRGRQIRETHPVQCWQCHETPDARWTTPSSGQEGLA